MAWCLGDEDDAYAEAALRSLRRLQALVPALWPFEVANALLMAERSGRIDSAATQQALRLLEGLPIKVDSATPCMPSEVLRLARAQGLTAYEAAYLELGVRQQLPLATLDRRLGEAARQLGLPLFMP